MITQGALFSVQRDTQKTLEKLSTGLRINRASDDAAGLSISENLRTQVTGLAMAKRNGQDGIALLNIAEGGINEIASILQRMRELAVQSTNDTLTSTERGYTNQEFNDLRDEITRIVNTTMYNSQNLLDGTGFGGVGKSSCIIHVGPNDVKAATAIADEIKIKINTMTTAKAGLNISTATLTNQTSAVKAITCLDDAINTVNKNRSTLGAYVNRLEHAINNIINQEHNNQSAESIIRDTDFAAETAIFTKNQILTQSATAMLSQANTLPQSVLSLLSR
jgi:flagellin